MREILFRGKTPVRGEWVYGDLIQIADGRKFIVNNKFGACIDEKGNFINTEYPFVNEVIPETVGQFTGLTDKNGKKIFEGDIVKTGSLQGKIVFNTKSCGFEFWYNIVVGAYGERATHKINLSTMRNYIVIGNIHDNPELLEV